MQQRGRYHGTCHSSSWQHNQLAAQNTRDLEITSNLLSQFLVCTRQRFVAHHFTSEFTWKRKTFGPKEREKQKIWANKNRKEKTTKNRQKEKKKETRNLQRIIMMNVVRPQNWSAKSQCACICVSVCVCVRVCSLFTLLLRHAWPQARTDFLLLPQLPPYYARANQPHQTPTPQKPPPSTQSNPAQLNIEQSRTKLKSRVASRVSCLVSRALAQLSSSSLAMACGWHRQQKHENFATNSQRTQKNNKLNLPYILCGYWASWYPVTGR